MTDYGKLNIGRKEYDEYIGKYVIITVIPQGQIYYGQLKNFQDRIATLNPYRGWALKNGKLEDCLLEKNKKIELRSINMDIEETSKEVIEKWCEISTSNSQKKTEQITGKSS